MNLHEQFEDFLAELGVEMEHPEDKQYNGDSIPEITIHQASRDHYGVFYRLDLVNQHPELRIMLPIDKGDLQTLCFPAEIEVYPLVMYEERRSNRRRLR